MAHGRAKLTVLGRQLLVSRVEGLGWSAPEAPRAQGVSRATADKWLRRFREEGAADLEDRSSRPHCSPQALDETAVARILTARVLEKAGPHALAARLGYPRSTIYGVLARRGLSRLADMDRSTGAPVRYQRDHPGELIHLDTKKLARIRDGGGWRAWGRGQVRRRRDAGYERVHSAVDDRSRVAFSEIVPDQDGPPSAQFLLDAAAFYASLGVKIQPVMTDRAKAYFSTPFQVALEAVGAQHRPTRPYRPQTNGKVERYQRTLTDRWAYARPYQANQERADAPPGFLHQDNQERPHTALAGQTTMAPSSTTSTGTTASAGAVIRSGQCPTAERAHPRLCPVATTWCGCLPASSPPGCPCRSGICDGRGSPASALRPGLSGRPE